MKMIPGAGNTIRGGKIITNERFPIRLKGGRGGPGMIGGPEIKRRRIYVALDMVSDE